MRSKIHVPAPEIGARPKLSEREPAPDASRITEVRIVEIGPDQSGMRLDRFLVSLAPGLSFAHIQRIIRKGEVRVDGKRADSKQRLEEGAKVRVPPLRLDAPERAPDSEQAKARAFLASVTLFEDGDVLVINKPMGLAVQGGSGTRHHIDGMLASLTDREGQRPRLVHRIDKDTAGCLIIAKTRFAASALARSFRSRETRKVYWALVAGALKLPQGRISSFLAREESAQGDTRVVSARHGQEGASHALTYYAIVEKAGKTIAWLSLKPVTGRTHQLRVHCAQIGHPIIGDDKYFDRMDWDLPTGLQNRLHLLARRIVIPHPRGGRVIDVTAPLPQHMAQSFAVLGFDATRYDPIDDAPED
jgi:23S rRNA pseudouridine955/2504/2580 synthase